MSARRVAALDIGGTRMKSCLFGGVPVRRGDGRRRGRGGAHVMAQATSRPEALGEFDAVSVSTAGQVDPRQQDHPLRQ